MKSNKTYSIHIPKTHPNHHQQMIAQSSDNFWKVQNELESVWKQKCAKNLNSNFSTINNMTHIQSFFNQYMPQYYLELVQAQASNPSFTQQNSLTNVFTLTAQIILSSQQSIKRIKGTQNTASFSSHWLIPYDSLKNTLLPVQDSDNAIARWMKSSLQYIHVQMLQIIIRMLFIFQDSRHSNNISSISRDYIQQISDIYPVLKIQISFSSIEVDLTSFFDKFLYLIEQKRGLTSVFGRALKEIAETCGFMGELNKLFLQYYKKSIPPKQDSISQQIMEHQKRECNLTSKPIQKSVSQLRDNQSLRKSSISCDKKSSDFNQFETFRKKKRIMKDRFKNQQQICKTPIHEKSGSNSPTTEKTGTYTFATRSDNTQNNASSLLYRKLVMNSKPRQRTLYHGQKKFFVPKKGHNHDPQKFIQRITAPTFIQQSNQFQFLLSNERKSSRAIIESTLDDNDTFYVPETPKPSNYKKTKLFSGQIQEPPSLKI